MHVVKVYIRPDMGDWYNGECYIHYVFVLSMFDLYMITYLAFVFVCTIFEI